MNAYTLSFNQLRDLPDEDVMELLQGGYDQALHIIVERYKEKIHNFIFRYTHNHLDAEDIAQETFIRVFRSRHRYERIAKFSTWLYTIALNLTKSLFKKNSKMIVNSISPQDDEDFDYERVLVSDVIAQDSALDQTICMEHIQNAMEQIPTEFKEVVTLRDIQSLTYEEIVEITGVPMGTVKSRINRGRARLKVILEKYIPEETIFS